MASAVEKYSVEQPQLSSDQASVGNDDESSAKISALYEKARSDIDKLKYKIQQLRKQKPNSHKTLRNNFEIRKKKEEEEKQKYTQENANNNNLDENKQQQNNNNGNNNNNNNNNNVNKYKPKLLNKLSVKLSEYKKLSGHGNKVYGCDWNPHNNNNIVSVGRDGKLIFWNADTGYKRAAYRLDTEFIMTLKFSPNAQYVACGGLDDILSIFPVKEETGMVDVEPTIYKAHTGYISCLQYINNETILTSSGDKTIREWDLEKQQKTPSYTYKIHTEDVMSMDLKPNDPNILLTGSVDSFAKIIDLRIKPQHDDADENDIKTNNYNNNNYASNVTHSFYMGYDSDLSKRNNRTTDVNVVKWFPNGTEFVAGCDDGTVRLFDTRSGKILSEYSYNKRDNIDDGGQGSGSGSGGGPRHSTGDKESVVRTSTNTPIQNESKNPDDEEEEIKDHEPLKASDDDPDYFEDELDPTDGVAALDFSKSGAFMFVSYNNDQHEVLVWNILENKVVQKIKHDDHVPCLQVSPDGTKLVTACWDHHLKLWTP